MKSLLLSGYNIHLRVDDGKLIVMDGRGWNKEPTEMIFQFNNMHYDNIIIYGNSGNLTLSAIDWLMKHNVSINIIDYNGSFLTSMDPPRSSSGHVKMAQYRAHQNDRIPISKRFIEGKIKRTETILKWLDERYPQVHPYVKNLDFNKMLRTLERSANGKSIISLDEELSEKYWIALKEVFPENFRFQARITSVSDIEGPTDPINTLFNYGYSLLEGICLRAINGANLDPNIGFIHRMKVTRSPLVTDFQEPFRWLVDKTIIQILEYGLFNMGDFIRSDNSTLQLRPDSAKKFVEEIDNTFSQPVKYKGRNHQWYVMIQIKAQEFANYLLNNRRDIDLSSPEPYLEKIDSQDIREKIMNITYSQWKKKGYTHGSLHYLKTKAMSDKPFKLNKNMADRIDSLDEK